MTPDRILGVLCLIAAGLTLFVWVPLDVDGGYVETVRRKLIIGDALAPTVAATIMAAAALGLLFEPSSTRATVSLDRKSWLWLAQLAAVLVVSLSLMRWTGPFASWILDAGEYRLLRDTVPWKYVGFLIGGTGLSFGLISLIERRLSLSRLVLCFCLVALMALFYDAPFDDLLLPPNGDV